MSQPTREDTDVLGKRVLAQFIDIVTTLAIATGILTIGSLVVSGLSVGIGSGVGTLLTGGVLFIVGLILLGTYAYRILLEAYWGGQTFGKRLVGIKVVSTEGGEPSLLAVTIRNLPAGLIYAAIFYVLAHIIGLISIGISDTRQRLFDRIAGTTVVKE